MSEKYDQAARDLFDAYKGVIGQAAEGIIKKNDDIDFEDGEIKAFHGEEDEIAEMIEDYRGVMGDVAYTLARQNLEDIKPENIQQ